MTDKKLEQIILTRRLPKDELDNFWDNLYGFVPSIMFLMAGIGPFIAIRTTLTPKTMWTILILSTAFFFYTIYCKLTEKNLKFINTGLNKEQNDTLIRELSKQEKWNGIPMKQYHTYILPFVWGHYGFKLTLIPIDDGILINFRNRGSIRARMPYNLGTETIKEARIKNRIKNYAQQRVCATGGGRPII